MRGNTLPRSVIEAFHFETFLPAFLSSLQPLCAACILSLVCVKDFSCMPLIEKSAAILLGLWVNNPKQPPGENNIPVKFSTLS